MKTGYIILLSLIPLIIGGLIVWLVFRNINKKYCHFFNQLIKVAGSNPSNIRAIIAGDAAHQAGIAALLGNLKKTKKTEIVKVGKKRTQLTLHALSHDDKIEKFNVIMEMQGTDNTSKAWQITEVNHL